MCTHDAWCREVKRHKDAQRYLNTELIGFLEPFTSRSNLSSVLRKCVDKMHRDYADAKVPPPPPLQDPWTAV